MYMDLFPQFLPPQRSFPPMLVRRLGFALKTCLFPALKRKDHTLSSRAEHVTEESATVIGVTLLSPEPQDFSPRPEFCVGMLETDSKTV